MTELAGNQPVWELGGSYPISVASRPGRALVSWSGCWPQPKRGTGSSPVGYTEVLAPTGNAVKDFYPPKNGGVARVTLGSNPQRSEMTSIPHRPRVGGKMIEG